MYLIKVWLSFNVQGTEGQAPCSTRGTWMILCARITHWNHKPAIHLSMYLTQSTYHLTRKSLYSHPTQSRLINVFNKNYSLIIFNSSPDGESVSMMLLSTQALMVCERIRVHKPFIYKFNTVAPDYGRYTLQWRRIGEENVSDARPDRGRSPTFSSLDLTGCI